MIRRPAWAGPAYDPIWANLLTRAEHPVPVRLLAGANAHALAPPTWPGPHSFLMEIVVPPPPPPQVGIGAG